MLVMAALVVSCGATGPHVGTVDPRELASRPSPEGAEAAEDDELDEADDPEAVLSEVLERLRRQPCAVHTYVALRSRLLDPVSEARIAELDGLARTLCDAGVSPVDAGWSADGEIELRPGSGGALVGDGVLFVFDGFESWRGSGTTGSVGEFACGGTVSEQPNLLIHPVDGSTTSVRVESDGAAFVWMRSPSGVDTCTNADSDDAPAEVLVPAAGGAHRLWVGAVDEPIEWRLHVESAETSRRSDARTWSWGQPFEVSAQVGPFERPVPSDDSSWCSGYIGDRPTQRVLVPEEGYGSIGVSSNDDPVLFVRGPSGEILCNDDYDGLDPFIDAWFGVGEWEVYVGSYGPGDVFEATLHFE